MGTVNFSIPDDVKDAFNATFEGVNKSAIVADLMREAIERAERKAASRGAIRRIVKARSKAPVRGDAALRRARESGRP
jgi:citrate lyase gamma subunit